jgi:hypothetical protein
MANQWFNYFFNRVQPRAGLAPIEGIAPIADVQIQALETNLGCQLPGDYREFLLTSNGGFPTPDCVTFLEDGQPTAADVCCFLAICDQGPFSIEWHYETFSGRLPENTIPIARDSCGNLWLLHVGSLATGSVHFWDHGSFDTFDETKLESWPQVAASFAEFRGKLKVFDPAPVSATVPSRYLLVKQAEASMAKRDPYFSTRRAKPACAWHCDCDEDGEISLQFVQYEVHAFATHTDGYSRLRAMKGVINEGATRLPG